MKSHLVRHLQVFAAAAALGVVVFGGWMGVNRMAAPVPTEIELGGYATGLAGRSASQRHNARLAARALHGSVVAPGATFSYNRTVRSWTVDRGYVKAPVSYDGELIRAFGGGVCQTSTTLYNAALLAGLPITERHPHVFAPTYVTPGRDAAVAQYDIDLRFKNPFSWPIRIQARVVGDRLDVRIHGRQRGGAAVEIVTEVLSITRPARLALDGPGAGGGRPTPSLQNPGVTGYRVRTYRVFVSDGHAARHELLSEDTYEPANRVVLLRQAQMP